LQHATSTLIFAILEELSPFEVLNLARWGLVHDNAEAYIGDIVRPLKHLSEFEFFNKIEERYDYLIAQWLGLGGVRVPPRVKDFDVEVCGYEAPIIFEGRLHPDWKFPPQSLQGFAHQWVVATIHAYANLPHGVEAIYLNRFRDLFPSFREEGL